MPDFSLTEENAQAKGTRKAAGMKGNKTQEMVSLNQVHRRPVLKTQLILTLKGQLAESCHRHQKGKGKACALKKLCGQVWYLSEELVALAFFY